MDSLFHLSPEHNIYPQNLFKLLPALPSCGFCSLLGCHQLMQDDVDFFSPTAVINSTLIMASEQKKRLVFFFI